MKNFDQAFSDFCQPGNRYNLLPRLTATGKAAGLSAEDIIRRAHEAGITNRDGDIRRLWNGSIIDPCSHGSQHSVKRSRPVVKPSLSKAKRDFVPRHLA